MIDNTPDAQQPTAGSGISTSGRSLSIASVRWVQLIDLSLVIVAVLMLVTNATVLFFHLVFVLLAFGAFFWNFRGFSLRVLFWVTLTIAVVIRAVVKGTTQADELIEIPLLLSILLTVFLIASRRAKTQKQLEQQAETLKQMQNDLHLTNNLLEQRISELSERTTELTNQNKGFEILNARDQRNASQLQALAQVTKTITAIRDLKELLPRIASVICENFGFYHIGVFLIDEVGEFAVLSAANSDGGQRMLERKHRLRIGDEGMVGHVAATGRPRIASDVVQDAIYFGNPDLPDTRAELALPLLSKENIIGVLDVQSTEAAAFSEGDIQMLSLLADQVSLAIENARLFEETRRALSESQMISRKSTREAWSRLSSEQGLLGYRYNVSGASPLTEPVELKESSKAQGKRQQKGSNSIVVPIELRGEVIGNLVVQAPSTGTWNEDQMDLIKAVAERVAISAENARLFEETTMRAERERLVSDITSKIRSHDDPQAMIQTAISELRNALGASSVEVIPQTVKGTNNLKA